MLGLFALASISSAELELGVGRCFALRRPGVDVSHAPPSTAQVLLHTVCCLEVQQTDKTFGVAITS